MSYQALYRTYRPTSFEEVVGQKHVVTTLMNAAKKNKIAHAYLFCGPRGTGKTSIARLLAKTLNCENPEKAPCNECSNCLASDAGTHQDIVEIDAASSSGVDQIRDLIEKVKYSPIQGRLKIYIIDEVHMLSQGAFNALLKTLEEPPAHVVFVLATTEPHKVLPTIISRCQRYDFTKVSDEEIVSRLTHVLSLEKIEVEQEALRLIATLSDGGMRDALSIMDQCIAYAQDKISLTHVNDVYGITTISQKLEMLEAIFNKDAKKILTMIQEYNEKGIDIRRLTNDLIEVLKEGVIYAYTQDPSLLKLLNEKEAKELAAKKKPDQYLTMVDVLMETTQSYRNASNVASYFEVAVLKMMAITEERGAPSKELVQEKPQEVKPRENKMSISPKEEPVLKKMTPEIQPQEMEMQETPVEEKEEVKPTVKRKVERPTLSVDFVLGLLVQADKDGKEKDRETWKRLKSKSKELAHARWARLLEDTSIEASGDDFVLLVCHVEAEANQINETENNKQLYTFIQEELQMDKMIYALSKENFNQVTAEFMDRYKAQTLPEKILIERYAREEKKQKVSKEDQLKEMFGDLLTIVDSEKGE